MNKDSESKVWPCLRDCVGTIVRVVLAIIVVIGGIFGFMPVKPLAFHGPRPSEQVLTVRNNRGKNFSHRTFSINLNNGTQQKEKIIFVENSEKPGQKIELEPGFFGRLFGSSESERNYVFSKNSVVVITDGDRVYFIKGKSSNPDSMLGHLSYASDSNGRYLRFKLVGASGLDIKKFKKDCALLQKQKINIAPQGILGIGRLYNILYSKVAALGTYGWTLMGLVMLAIFSPLLVFYIFKMLRARRAKREVEYIKGDNTLNAKQKKDKIQGIVQQHAGFASMILQNVPVIVYYLDSSFGPGWCADLFRRSFLWSRSVAMSPCTSALWKNRFFQPTITGLVGAIVLSGLFELQQQSLQVDDNGMHWAMKIISVIAIYSWCNGSSMGTVFSVVIFSALWNLIAWASVLITEQVQKN
jgi:uncharacterized membrane protein